MIALYGSPILVESAAVRGVTDKYDAALDALVSPDAAVAAAVAESDQARHVRDAANHDGGLLIDAETAAADGAAVEMMVASFSHALPQLDRVQDQMRDQQQPEDQQQQQEQQEFDRQAVDESASAADDSSEPDDASASAPPTAELQPLTAVKLLYRPLLPIDPRKLNKFYLHPAYAVFFWTTCVFTILMFGITSWNPTGVAHFTIMMIIWTGIIILEYGRLDRVLLYHCVKSFDLVFLFVYLTGFVTLQLYATLGHASAFEDTRPQADIVRTNIAAKCVPFPHVIFAPIFDRMAV